MSSSQSLFSLKKAVDSKDEVTEESKVEAPEAKKAVAKKD